MISKFTFILILNLTLISDKTYSQNSIDTTFGVEINLHYQIPSFSYWNSQIKTGAFACQIDYNGQRFIVQGGFKDFKAEGLWAAIDSAGIPRLLSLFRSDTLVFKHLNDSLGRPAHHFTYQNNNLLNEEWYNQGRLDQYNEYSSNGCIITGYHESMKPRLTFFINEKGVPYKKIVYDDHGVFIKETSNMNEY